MKKLLLILSLSFCFFNSFSQQAPGIEWQRSLGGSDLDFGYSVVQTFDGGFIVAGQTYSNDSNVTNYHGASDYWVVKLDVTGNIQWQKCLGGTGLDVAYSIKQTYEGGYIMAGSSSSNDGDVTNNNGGDDYWIVKLDSAGNIQWQKSFGGSLEDIAYSIIQTIDKGYFTAGFTLSNDSDVTGNHGNYDFWVLKLDSAGSLEWQKSLGGSLLDQAFSCQQVIDGGYIVAGGSKSSDGNVTLNHGDSDYWIIKLDSIGTIQWQKSFGGTNLDQANSVIHSSDGNFIAAGLSYSTDGDVVGNHGIFDNWVLKFDSSGNIQWQNSLGGSDYDYAASIHMTTDKKYIICGGTVSNDGDVTNNHGSSDIWVTKLDSSGYLLWQNCLGGTVNDDGYSIVQTTDEGFIIAGQTLSNDGDVTVNNGIVDYWIVKLFPDTITSLPHLNPQNSNFQLFPNPACNQFTISGLPFTVESYELSITDILGKELYRKTVNRKQETVNIHLPNSIYIIKAFTDKGVFQQKLIIAHP